MRTLGSRDPRVDITTGVLGREAELNIGIGSNILESSRSIARIRVCSTKVFIQYIDRSCLHFSYSTCAVGGNLVRCVVKIVVRRYNIFLANT